MEVSRYILDFVKANSSDLFIKNIISKRVPHTATDIYIYLLSSMSFFFCLLLLRNRICLFEWDGRYQSVVLLSVSSWVRLQPALSNSGPRTESLCHKKGCDASAFFISRNDSFLFIILSNCFFFLPVIA